MNELFGDVKSPWVPTEEAPRTIENVILPIAALPTARLTRPRRLARGTLVDMFDPKHWAADDDDALTRGRRSMRRSSSPFLAA